MPALFSATLFAQTTGTISGRVYDERTGRSLEGAVVRAVGTNVVDYTAADGRYSLNVPAGTATLEVEYVGLDTLRQQVTISPGASVRHDAPLKSTILEMDSFVVQESARGQALAINQQRTASGIVNIVSEEVFGQMVDGNIGQALQRLPGLSVNEDQDGAPSQINIRGVSGIYNSFQIDGNRAPTTGATSRSFNVRDLSAEGIANIEVIKAATPDRDGDAIGGTINVISRSAFQRDGREIKLKLSGVYSDLPKKWGHSASLSFSDLFSVGGGDRNLGISATVSTNKTNRYSIDADLAWNLVTPENNPQLNLVPPAGYPYPIWGFEGTHWEYDTRVTKTNTINGSIDFRIDEHTSFYLRPLYSFHDRRGVKYETDQDVDVRFQDAPNGRKTYAELTYNYGRGTPGTNGSRARRQWIGTENEQEHFTHSFSFGGRHEKADNLITADMYYARAKTVITKNDELNFLMQPTNPSFLMEYHVINAAKGLVLMNHLDNYDHTDLSLVSLGNYFEVNSVKIEDVYSGRVDWERKFTGDRAAFALKSGAKYRASKPRFDRKREQYTMGPNFPYDRIVTPTDAWLFGKPKYYDVHPHMARALVRSNPELFGYNANLSVQNSNVADYDASEETSAAYTMGTLRFGPHTIIGGVRFERNEWSSTRKDVRLGAAGTTPVVTPVKRGASYGYWLPGLHLRHELRPNLILRESFNQSYGRANLAQLTRGRLTALNGNITDGNENLKPAFSNNFDAQLEYYTARSGLYSVGFFYKDMKDFTFVRISRFDELDANGIPIAMTGGSFQYSRPENGSTARNMGVELIARQRLFFLPGVLQGFSAGVSATLSKSEANYPDRPDRDDLPLAGFSDVLFTAELEYARGNFRARVGYRFRGDYIDNLSTSIEDDDFQDAEDRVDAEISYRLRKNLTLFADGTNLSNRWRVAYQGYPPYVEDAAFSGRKYTFGVQYSF